MTFLPGDFLRPSEEAFLAVESLFLRFRQSKKYLSPKLQNIEQLLLMSFFDPTTFIFGHFLTLFQKGL